MDRNEVTLSGVMACAPRFVTERYGERMFEGYMRVKRQSGAEDMLPLHMGEYTLARRLESIQAGVPVRVTGEIRRYKRSEEEPVKSGIAVYVRKLELGGDYGEDENRVALEGVVMKAPVHRVTPRGREVCEVVIRSTGGFKRTAAVTMLAWGNMAAWANMLEVGERVRAEGRLQCRQYTGRGEDGTSYNCTAYEVSLTMLRLQEEEPE